MLLWPLCWHRAAFGRRSRGRSTDLDRRAAGRADSVSADRFLNPNPRLLLRFLSLSGLLASVSPVPSSSSCSHRVFQSFIVALDQMIIGLSIYPSVFPVYPPLLAFILRSHCSPCHLFCLPVSHTTAVGSERVLPCVTSLPSDSHPNPPPRTVTQATGTLTFGQLYTFLSAKYTFLFSILLFEIGSILSAAAPTFWLLILGRAVSGLGAGGLVVGMHTIVGQVVRLQDRAIYYSTLGVVFSAASVGGPLMGGLLTDRFSWRFCFWVRFFPSWLACRPISDPCPVCLSSPYRSTSHSAPLYVLHFTIMGAPDHPGTNAFI